MSFLFFSDSSVFGGHEMVCLDIANVLSTHGDVFFASNPKNDNLTHRVKDRFGSDALLSVSAHHKRAALYLAPVRRQEQIEVLDVVKKLSPDVVLLCQGRIETCAPQMFALARKRIPFVSVLPFAHGIEEIKPGSSFRRVENLIRFPYYRLPSAFIVPSETARQQLSDRGVVAPVHVLPNIVPKLEFAPDDALDGRKTLRCVGRIEFQQKRQDMLVRLIAEKADAFRKYKIEFVGDGPDLGSLLDLITELGVSDFVKASGGVSRDRVLSGASALLMPSKFEGLPLVMLEALGAGLPFVGSDIDIFRGYLPNEAVNSFKNPTDLLRTIESVLSPDYRSTWDSVKSRILENHSSAALNQAVEEMMSVGLPTARGGS